MDFWGGLCCGAVLLALCLVGGYWLWMKKEGYW